MLIHYNRWIFFINYIEFILLSILFTAISNKLIKNIPLIINNNFTPSHCLLPQKENDFFSNIKKNINFFNKIMFFLKNKYISANKKYEKIKKIKHNFLTPKEYHIIIQDLLAYLYIEHKKRNNKQKGLIGLPNHAFIQEIKLSAYEGIIEIIPTYLIKKLMVSIDRLNNIIWQSHTENEK